VIGLWHWPPTSPSSAEIKLRALKACYRMIFTFIYCVDRNVYDFELIVASILQVQPILNLLQFWFLNFIPKNSTLQYF
jgi:hypothetical protein